MEETIAAPTPNEQPIFEAQLRPHRSLGRTGFLLVLMTFAASWLFVGAIALSRGAWPVLGYCGLDLVAVYVAFKLNYRSAKACEEISLSRIELKIRQFAPSGRVRQHHFNPFWARFRVARHDEIGITSMNVEGHGRSVQVGSFLNPDDRENFASAFSQALATTRR
jgi:uncharacterized membrane protein